MLLCLLLDEVRRKSLLCVSGEGKNLNSCKSKSENLGRRDRRWWCGPTNRSAYDLKLLDFKGFVLPCEKRRRKFLLLPEVTMNPDKNLFHASGLLRRGIIKLSDWCQNLFLGRQMHVLCREVVWGRIRWLLHAHKLLFNEELRSSPLAPGTVLVMMIILSPIFGIGILCL